MCGASGDSGTSMTSNPRPEAGADSNTWVRTSSEGATRLATTWVTVSRTPVSRSISTGVKPNPSSSSATP